MLKETETEETIVFFVTFLSLVAVQLEGALAPHGYAYGLVVTMKMHQTFRLYNG